MNSLGISVNVNGTAVSIFGDAPRISVRAEELARGWLRNAGDERRLRAWARFVHGAVALLELDVDRHPLGDQLLDSLWRVSFGEQITEEMDRVARRVLIETR